MRPVVVYAIVATILTTVLGAEAFFQSRRADALAAALDAARRTAVTAPSDSTEFTPADIARLDAEARRNKRAADEMVYVMSHTGHEHDTPKPAKSKP